MKRKGKIILNDGDQKTKDSPLNGTFVPAEEEKTLEDIKPVGFLQLFRYADSLDKILLSFGILSTIGTVIMQPLNMHVFGDLTEAMVEFAYTLTTSVDPEVIQEASDKFFESIRMFAIYNSLIGLVTFITSYMSTVLFNYSALRQMFRIRTLYVEKTLNQDISWYDVNQTGDLASRMSEDLSKFEDGIGEKVPMFINFVLAFIALLTLALIKGWELALICLISLPVTMLALGIVTLLTSKIAKKELDAYGSAGSIAEEVLSAIRTVVAFGGQQKETTRYEEKLVYARDNNIKRSMLGGIGFGLLWFFIYSSYALAFWYGVGLVLKERDYDLADRTYDAGTMVSVFFSVMMGSMNFGMASPYIETFGIAKAAAAKVYSVIDNIPIINASKGKGERPERIEGNIKFDSVHFQYPSRKAVNVLQGLNLTIKAGETVALVGSSGCGKSTCLQLIQRFYDPSAGTIYLDGNDLKSLDLTWLRRSIGVVSQEPVLFGTTIAENIKYGCITASQEDIEKAAIKANAHEFIRTLPQGYDTIVGERGAQLSGGQKQRIAIARALVRNPPILILDEATSALDTNSEAKVQAALDSASKERTTIIVAHRLSTIRGANKIVVVSEGNVVEQGTHRELMDLKGEYFSLVTAQVSSDDSAAVSTPDDSVIPHSPLDFEDGKRLSNASIKENITATNEYEEEADEELQNLSLWDIVKLNNAEMPHILLGCLASFLLGATMPIFAVLFGEIIGILADSDEDYITRKTNEYCLYFVATGIITGVSNFLQLYMFGIAGEKLTMRLRTKMFVAMLGQEVGWFDRKENGVGALCARLSGEAAQVQGATGQRIGTVLQSVSTIGIAVGLSMYYEWRLGLVALSFTPFILIATFLQQRLMYIENQTQTETLQSSTKIAVEAVSNVRTVVSLGCEETFHQLYVINLLPHYKKALPNQHVRGLVFGLARSLMYFAFAACMYYGGILIRDEGIPYGDIFKVSQSLIMGTTTIANALAFTPNFQKGITAAARILKLINRAPVVTDSPNAQDKNMDKGNVDYSQINFSYPTRPNAAVLRGLDLSITEGQTVALVGPSGCGKSTIIQLLERFYDPKAGQITIDKTDTKSVTLASLRSHLGIVSQEPNLFDRTIAENIAYGDNSRAVTTDEIIEAAKNANIHNFISSLPLGYETRLGERGTQLSGGQKQRVAIARALVRNPKILLLDEATSALDTESEKIVQEALDNAKRGRTCITIAHRLTTIQDADVICVINGGKVAEQGTHSQLLSRRGLYYRLHNLQQNRK